jgi:arsenate reductase (glutaredoxin)
LTEKGLDFETINYFENPVSESELKKLLHAAGLKPIDALRTNEAAYRQQVAGRDLSEEQLLRVMMKHPELIQRPIVVRGSRAVLARPADKLAELGIK